MRRTGPGRGADQGPRLVAVTFLAARAVHDDLGPGHRGVDPLARIQVTGHEFDTLGRFAVAPAEHPHLAAGVSQTRDDQTPKRPGAAGYQDV